MTTGRRPAADFAPQLLEPRLLLSAADPVPPVATIVTPDVTVGGGATQAVTVNYTDNVAIARTSVGQSDVTVTGPDGTPLAFKSVVAYPLDSAPQVVGTYVFTAPGGTWGPEDNGTYTVTVLADNVFDTGGNAVPQTVKTFTVNIPAGSARDTTPPTETIALPAPPTFGSASETVQVTYSDNVGVDPTLVDAGNVQVFRPGGGQLAITGASESPSPDGKAVIATYTFAAPGGSWGPEDAGTYTVKVLSGHVTDTSGNPNPEAQLKFNVSANPSPATLGLLATISPPSQITAAGGATQTISVTYRSPAGVDVASIDPADLFVSRSGGPALTVTGVSVSPPSGGTAVTATYTIAAPGGAWDPTDNGTYVVTIQPNQVMDLAGDAAASFSGSFAVNVPTPRPTVDPTFNPPPPTSSGFIAEDTAALSGGKVIVVGRTGDLSAGTGQAVIERLNADGSLDTSFGPAGSGGKVTTPASTADAYFAVRLEPDGSIVTAGTRGGDFAVTRFRANGTLDPRFGHGGVAVADLGAQDVAYGLAVAPDGSIVAAGGSGASYAFARFLSSGRLDPSFGQGGTRVFPLTAGAGDVIGDLDFAPDGSVFAAGASGPSVVLLHLSATGNPVTTFGTGGVEPVAGLTARTDLPVPDYTEGIAVQGDGRVLVASRTAAGDFGVARLNANGSLDTAFGPSATPGLATADFGGDDDADRVFVQATGEVFAVGTTSASGTTQTAVAAFNPDGTLDTAFANNGLFTAPLGSSPGTGAAARQTSAGASDSLSPLAIHIGDLFLHAFGSPGPGGQLVIGAAGEAGTGVTAAPAPSTIRRLFVPGSNLLGQFGAGTAARGGNGRLHFIASDGTAVTVSVTGGGAGRAFYDGTHVDLVLTGTGPRSVVSVQTSGGSAGSGAASHSPFLLRNVRCDGPLRAFTAPAVDLDGTLSVPGGLGTVTVAALTGTIAAQTLGNLSVLGNVTGAAVLSGANLGSDGQFGGTGTAADTFATGSIARVRVNGSVTGSVFAAGLNPGPGATRGSLLNAAATVVGGAASRIGPVFVKGGTDAATRFVAGAFATARLPGKVVPADDPRFQMI